MSILANLNLKDKIDQSWLSDCLSYLEKEMEETVKDQAPASRSKEKRLEEQLLHSDLKDYGLGYEWIAQMIRDSQASSLLDRKGKAQSSTLAPTQHNYLKDKTGFYFQIEDIKEIGSSNSAILEAVQQLCQQGDAPSTKTRPAGASSATLIPRHVLKYTLTDGIHILSAIERVPIPSLTLLSPLGTKVLVRRGTLVQSTLMLEEVVVLGGGVEDMNVLDRRECIENDCRRRLGMEVKERKKEKIKKESIIEHQLSQAPSFPPPSAPAPRPIQQRQQQTTTMNYQQQQQQSKQPTVLYPSTNSLKVASASIQKSNHHPITSTFTSRRESTKSMDQIYKVFGSGDGGGDDDDVAHDLSQPMLTDNAYGDNGINDADCLCLEDEFGDMDDFEFDQIDDHYLDNANNGQKYQERNQQSPVFNLFNSVSDGANLHNLPDFEEEEEEEDLPINMKKANRRLSIAILDSSPVNQKSKKQKSASQSISLSQQSVPKHLPPLSIPSLASLHLPSTPAGKYTTYAKTNSHTKISANDDSNTFSLSLNVSGKGLPGSGKSREAAYDVPVESAVICEMIGFPGPKEFKDFREEDPIRSKEVCF